MTLWKHQQEMDHLRRRAEFHIEKGRVHNSPGSASQGRKIGHKTIMSDARSMGVRDDLNGSPCLSEMSGAENLKNNS